MPEDVFTSSACPWLKFLQFPILQKFLPRGRRTVCLLFVLAIAQLQSQVSYSQYAAFNSVAVNSFQSTLTWATGISTYDINHDGWDDITAASSQHGVAVYLNTHGDFEYINALENIEGNLKTVYWADYDNDADADILIIRYVAEPILLRNDGDWMFTDVTSSLNIPMFSPLMQSASWADYDNDGWIDLYINNYDLQSEVTNWLFHNNGDGTFSEVASIVGVDNGSLPTYQSTWIDFDRDGDQDIYVTNDRDAGNQLYINNGQGYFTPDTSSVMNLFMDSMGVQWHDHDYDGDFDCYISNEIEASVLIENRQGVFVNVTDSLQVGCPNHVSWGVQWTDPDNDGLDDLCIVNKDFSNITCHFQRNADLSYSLSSSSILSQQPYSSYCLVTGDFNNDGQEDLVQNTVSPQHIYTWLASPSANNSLTIGLIGTASNRDGIGAIIEVHANNRQIIKQVTAGESYYGQSSQYERFGIGSTSIIDSVVVNWPSGWKDVLYYPDANQSLTITEGSSYVDRPDTLSEYLCFGTSVMLETATENGAQWDDGETVSTRLIDTPGTYSCTVQGPFNHTHRIVFNVIDFSPSFISEVTPIDCADAATGSIAVSSIEGWNSISWLDADNDSSTRTALAAGVYEAQIIFGNGCSHSLSFTLDNPEPIIAWITADSVCENSTTSITYSSEGGIGNHFWNWFNENPESVTPGDYPYTITDEAGCTKQGQFTVYAFEKPQLNWNTPYVCAEQTLPFAISNSEPLLIQWSENTEPYALLPGQYAFSYSADEGCWYDTVYTVLEFPQPQLSILPTDSICASGNALFFAEINGGTAPFSYLWNTGDIDAYAQTNGLPVLSCILTDGNGCSVQEELWMNDINTLATAAISIYPNPANSYAFIIAAAGSHWTIHDARGKAVIEGKLQSSSERLDIRQLATGIYTLRIGNTTRKLIKTD